MNKTSPAFFENASPKQPKPSPGSIFNVIFCSSTLDDYGLTPSEFRVFCHIARRAGRECCFAAVESIARICQLHQQTVRKVLRSLTARNMITREDRPGETSIYRLTMPARWNPQPTGLSSPSSNQCTASDSAQSSTKSMDTHPTEIDGVKVNPTEMDPREGIHSPLPPAGESVSRAVSLNVGAMGEAIYSAYPVKTGRPGALRAIAKAIAKHGFEFVLARTQQYAAICGNEIRYVPAPARWFRDERYADEPSTWHRLSNSPPRFRPLVVNAENFGSGVSKL